MEAPKDHTQSSLSNSLNSWNAPAKADPTLPVSKRYRFDSLTTSQFWAYCVGHVLNDLCSACWFNYLLFYLKLVIKIDYGAYAMLSGQVADAIGTPLVGYFSDNTNTKYGKRIPWYVGGYFAVVVTFLPVWNGPLIFQWLGTTNQILQAVYYVVFPALFNFGWASLQISHMSLVPSLTCCRSKRDRLNSFRNTFQFIAVLIVYLTAFAFFYQPDDSVPAMDPIIAFRYLSFICVGVGTATSLYFLMEIDEPFLTKECAKYAKQLTKLLKQKQNGLAPSDQTNLIADETQKKHQVGEVSPTLSSDSIFDAEGNIVNTVKLTEYDFSENETHDLVKQRASKGSMSEDVTKWTDWFKQWPFYRYGLVYMGVRLYCNVSSTMLSFYIANVLEFTDAEAETFIVPMEVALIPLSLYILSVLTSALLSYMYDWFGKKITITIGTVLCILSSVGLLFLDKENRYLMYVIAPVIGAAQAITLNTGITLISDVIGLKGSSGAFVFGAYSFLDKISCGIVLFVCANGDILDHKELVRWITVVVPSVSCVFGWLLVVTASNKQESTDGMDKERSKSLQDELAT